MGRVVLHSDLGPIVGEREDGMDACRVLLKLVSDSTVIGSDDSSLSLGDIGGVMGASDNFAWGSR